MIYGEEIIEEVRSRNDIVDLISTYVPLKKKGSSYFGLCPFHNEKSPSFSVSRDKQMYYCFGCGAGGNVFTFLMEYENFSFPEALKYLAERAGMELPEEELNEEAKRAMDEKARLREMNKLSANYFYYLLHSKRGQKGLAYLKDRGITDATIKHFGLGYADIYNDDLYRFLKSKGYSDEDLKDSALVTIDERRGGSDKFWNRVMFPIMDVNNRVIGFGGRVMGDGSPKYLNSKETKLFDKSRNLYGLNFARSSRKKEIILCEGYMDVISMHQAGFTNAVASLGTALTSGHASLLKRYTQEVLLLYDSDDAGVRAALRAIPILREAGVSSRVVNLKPHKDPDEFMKGLSPEAFKERIEQAKSSFFYEVDNLMKEYDMNDPESKTSFMNEVAKKCLTFDNEIERTNYMEAFCREYSVRTEDFKKLVAYHSARMVGIDYEKRRQERMVKTAGQKEDGIAKSQGVFLTWLSNDPVLFEKTKGILSAEDFVDEPYHEVAQMIYEQYETTGKVEPAMIISKFQSKEEQSLVAGIFNKELKEISKDTEQQKALNEVVHSIKKYSLEYRSRHVTDMKELQTLMEEKRKLQTLQISF